MAGRLVTQGKKQRAKRRRGRPAICVKRTAPNTSCYGDATEPLDDYDEAKLTYECSLFTQELCKMLQRVAVKSELYQFWKEPIYHFLTQVAKELFLTEMEAALWSLILCHTDRTFPEVNFLLFLRITAFASRKLIEGEVLLHKVEIAMNRELGFREFYEAWFERNKEDIKFSLNDINQEYEKLMQPIGSEDAHPVLFAFIVDDVLDEPFETEDLALEYTLRHGMQEVKNETVAQPLPDPIPRPATTFPCHPNPFGHFPMPPGQLPTQQLPMAIHQLQGFDPFRDQSRPPFT